MTVKSAESEDLRQAFEKHHGETELQIERLEAVFERCGATPRAIRCEAIDGILAEAKDVMQEIEDAKFTMPVYSQRLRPWSIMRLRDTGR
jgi:ferritin-like metal-binding protein YciE